MKQPEPIASLRSAKTYIKECLVTKVLNSPTASSWIEHVLEDKEDIDTHTYIQRSCQQQGDR